MDFPTAFSFVSCASNFQTIAWKKKGIVFVGECSLSAYANCHNWIVFPFSLITSNSEINGCNDGIMNDGNVTALTKQSQMQLTAYQEDFPKIFHYLLLISPFSITATRLDYTVPSLTSRVNYPCRAYFRQFN